jgi:ABC-2 type transport system permease protein
MAQYSLNEPLPAEVFEGGSDPWIGCRAFPTYSGQLVYGALMLAIGAAVNRIADAQSLMGPVMLLLLAPYVLVPMIGRAPNSTLSVAISFIPPINSFAMLARLASGTPPPLWQVFGSVAAGVAGACVAVWFAAKVFKIGLLMQGKPPSFGTLVRWARMA